MDRNDVIRPAIDVFLAVALRKESVDRNFNIRHTTSPRPRSLSARRAWIEIAEDWLNAGSLSVALRKESVDRNTMRRDFKSLGLPSLSARRAWIEMKAGQTYHCENSPSLSARRAWIEIM